MLALTALLAGLAGCKHAPKQAAAVAATVSDRGPLHPLPPQPREDRGLHTTDQRDRFRVETPAGLRGALADADRGAVEALRKPSTQARCEALEQLHSPQNVQPVVPWIVALLADDAPSWQSPRNALMAKPTVGDVAAEVVVGLATAAVPALLEYAAATGNPAHGRIRAVLTLGRIEDERIIAPLLQALASDREPGVRQACVLALAGAPAQLVAGGLTAALRDGDEFVRHDAVTALGRLKVTAATPALLPMLNDPSATVRAGVIRALGDLKATEAVPQLISLISSPERELRFAAVQALGLIGDERGIRPVMSLVTDPQLCATAVRALGAMKAKDELPIILKTVHDDRPQMRQACCEALGDLGGSQAVAGLVDALDDKDEAVAETAGKALGETGDAAALGPLLKSTAAPTPEKVRWQAIEALGKLHNTGAVPRLVELLTDPNVLFSFTAATALGEIKDPTSVSALRAVCDGTSTRTRWNHSDKAMLALARFGSETALPVLLSLSQDRDDQVRLEADTALAELTTPEAQDALQTGLLDKDATARERVRRLLLKQKGWGKPLSGT